MLIKYEYLKFFLLFNYNYLIIDNSRYLINIYICVCKANSNLINITDFHI